MSPSYDHIEPRIGIHSVYFNLKCHTRKSMYALKHFEWIHVTQSILNLIAIPQIQ